MKKFNLKLLTPSLVISLLSMGALFSSQTAAAGVSAVGSFTIGEAKTTPAQASYTQGAGISGGLLLGIRSSKKVSLEIGALYTPFTFKSASTAIKQNYLQIPVLLRFRMGRIASFGVGASYDLKQGGAYEANIANSAYNSYFKDNLSAVASLALRLPMGKRLGFLVDARYYYGLTNQTGVAATTQFNQIQMLGGLNIAF